MISNLIILKGTGSVTRSTILRVLQENLSDSMPQAVGAKPFRVAKCGVIKAVSHMTRYGLIFDHQSGQLV